MPYKDPERQKERNRRYRAANREKLIEQDRQYKLDHPNAYREWSEANKDHRKEYMAAWRRKNLAHRREYHKEYEEKNKENLLAARRVHRQKNRDRINAQKREWDKTEKAQQWRDKNAEKLKEQHKISALIAYAKHRDKYKEFAAIYNGKYPRRAAIYAKWEEAQRLCYICGLHLEKEDTTIDHVHPRAKGGENEITNLMPTHFECNLAKRDKLNFPIARIDLIAATTHIKALPRKIRAYKPDRWLNSKARRVLEAGQ